VLAQLRTTEHQVAVIERDPHARGVALARELGVPLLLEDAGAPGVLDRARISHSKSLLVLTRDDGENLDIAMAAREINPGVRVVMRLYDDDFAATVSRTMRASYPDATTRSHSVSALAAPSFAAAMMGRHVLGVMLVERGSLLFTTVDVAGLPELEGRSVHQAFRENEWRVVAVGSAIRPQSSAPRDTLGGLRLDGPGFDWRPSHGTTLHAGDRGVVASTRRGLDFLMTLHRHFLPRGLRNALAFHTGPERARLVPRADGPALPRRHCGDCRCGRERPEAVSPFIEPTECNAAASSERSRARGPGPGPSMSSRRPSSSRPSRSQMPDGRAMVADREEVPGLLQHLGRIRYQ